MGQWKPFHCLTEPQNEYKWFCNSSTWETCWNYSPDHQKRLIIAIASYIPLFFSKIMTTVLSIIENIKIFFFVAETWLHSLVQVTWNSAAQQHPRTFTSFQLSCEDWNAFQYRLKGYPFPAQTAVSVRCNIIAKQKTRLNANEASVNMFDSLTIGSPIVLLRDMVFWLPCYLFEVSYKQLGNCHNAHELNVSR